MAINPAALAVLLTESLSGKPAVCAYWKVYWDADDAAQTRYYSDSAFQEQPPFHNIGVTIEPRVLGSIVKETTFEINPDLRTETITIKFDDIDKVITGRFQTYKSGVRCELVFYYPATADRASITESVWFGQLTSPKVFGWKSLSCIATNGFRSREQPIPRRTRPRECTSDFGGLKPAESIRTNGCSYDRHVGGVTGLLDLATGLPFLDCPRMSEADCTARFGHALYYLGFNTDASATITDYNNGGYLAVSKGNKSALADPIPVVAGTKHVRKCQLLLWRREVNQGNVEYGYVSGVYEICEGSVKQISNIRVKDKLIEPLHLGVRIGQRAQPSSGYATQMSNFSATALFFARYGPTNAAKIEAKDLNAECDVQGYNEVAVFNQTVAGFGLVGDYSDGGFVGSRVDYEINFPSSSGGPFPGIGSQPFSVEWNGFITSTVAGVHNFECLHDDGVVLIINGVTVLSNAVYGTTTGSFTFAANTAYTIKINFTQNPAGGYNPWALVLKWQQPAGAMVVVPNSAYTNNGATGLIRQWSDDRVWWVLELYSNQRFGLAYPHSRFNIADFQSVSTWGLQTVDFTFQFADGESETYTHRRTTFNAILESRPAAEQIEDICRSGGFSIPFQHDGSFSVAAFRAATAGELTAARVFTDTGEGRNICWDKEPMITLEQTPNDKVVNEIELSFEEALNKDTERPIKVDDPNQKLLAGRELGDGNLKTVPKKYSAFGVRTLEEAVKLAYRFLRFGSFDEGGTHNNLKLTVTVPYEQSLGLKRYDIIEITSALTSGFLSPEGAEFVYYRILSMKKISNGRCQITGQAYNHAAYTAFETLVTQFPNLNPQPEQVAILPKPEVLTISAASYDSVLGNIEVTVT